MSLDSMGTPNQSASTAGVGRMTHSLSTPSGVDGTPAAVSRGGKKLAIRIQMLDDSVTLFQVQVRNEFVFLFKILGIQKILVLVFLIFKFKF